MLNYKLTAAEQETSVVCCRADNAVTVFTSDRRDMKRLDTLCERFPEVYHRTWVDDQIMGDGLPMGKKYTFPRRFFRFVTPRSDAQRAAAARNAAVARSARQNVSSDEGF